MAANKTQVTPVDPLDFVTSVEPAARRADAEVLLELMGRVTGCAPRMWGPSIVGFGRYHYRYESGREGDSMIVGFSPRKAKLVVYVPSGYDGFADHLARLGPHELGKACLYLPSLGRIDLGVLEQIVTDGVAQMRRRYDTFDD